LAGGRRSGWGLAGINRRTPFRLRGSFRIHRFPALRSWEGFCRRSSDGLIGPRPLLPWLPQAIVAAAALSTLPEMVPVFCFALECSLAECGSNSTAELGSRYRLPGIPSKRDALQLLPRDTHLDGSLLEVHGNKTFSLPARAETSWHRMERKLRKLEKKKLPFLSLVTVTATARLETFAPAQRRPLIPSPAHQRLVNRPKNQNKRPPAFQQSFLTPARLDRSWHGSLYVRGFRRI
jgi:hypothetical protein